MKKFTLLIALLLTFVWQGQAQYGCESAVVISDGYTVTGVTSPGTGGAEDWNENPSGTSINSSYWDDDVYLFQYTSGATAETISISIFTRNNWNGVGIFDDCTGTTFSNELAASGSSSASDFTHTLSATIPAGNTVYIAIGQWGTPNGVDFDVTDFSVTAITCPAPSELTATNISTTTADLGWTALGSETMWNIEVADAGMATGTATATGVSNPYNATGLTANTAYEFYIQADCGGGDVSTWAGPFAFTTDCAAISTMSEDFDSYSTGSIVPDCWERLVPDTDLGSQTITSTSPASGTRNIYQYAGTTSNPVIVVLPSFDNIDAGTHWLRLKARVSSGAPGTLSVGYVTDVTDYSSFTVIQDLSITNTSYTATDSEYTVAVPSSVPSNARLAIKNASDAKSYYWDDVYWEEVPSCLAPTALTATNITATSADLGWTLGDAETTWNIEIVAAGDTPTGTGTATTDNPYTATAITAGAAFTANTAYEFYVQADCGGGDVSTWEGPFAFITACESVSVFPWTEDFEAVTTPALPDCWDEIDNNSDTDFWKTYSTYGSEGSKAAGLGTDYNDGDNDDYLILPPFALTGNERLIFSVRARSTSEPNDYRVVLSTTGTDPADFDTELMPLTTVSNTTHTEIAPINLNAFTGDVYIAVHVPSGGLDGYYIYFDDFTVEEIPSCPDPTAFTATNMTATTADLGWTAGYVETAWNIEIVAAGDTPTGTGTATTDNPYPATATTAGDAFTATTSYEFYVQADCGGGDVSAWVGPFAFTTPCAAFDLPVSENFDGTSTGTSTSPTVPDCWTFIDGGSGYGYVSSIGANSFYMYNSSDATGDYILVSPSITGVSSGDNRIVFDADGSAGQELIIGTMTDVSDVSTFTAIQTITLATSDYEEFIVDIPAGTDSHIAIKHGLTGTYDSYYIDNIVVEAIPSCLVPTALTATNITAASADLGWTAENGETAWNIEIVAAGDTPTGTGTATTDNPYTATATTAGAAFTATTSYEFYIQADCGGDISTWAGPFAFTTECEAINTFPSYTDFTNVPPTDCWSQAGDGEVADGPSGFGDSDWKNNRAYENSLGEVVSSNVMNLFDMEDREWLISPTYDLSAEGPYRLVVEVAVTDYAYSGTTTTGDTMGADDEVKLLMSTDNGATWVELTTWTEVNQPSVNGTTYIEDLSSVTADAKFAIWASDGIVDEGVDYDFHIGVFTVEAIPSCEAPTALTATNITATTADLGWSLGEAETAWNIEIVAAGDTPTGTGTATTDNPYTATATTAGAAFTANTAYEFYVQADCGGGDVSTWVGPFAFSTACDIVTAPFAEGFETTADGEIPNCWTVINNGDVNGWDVNASPSETAYEGSQVISIPYNSSDAHDDYLITPQMSIVVGTTDMFTFYASNRLDYAEEFNVLVSTTGTDVADFTLVDGPIISTDDWMEYSYDLSAYDGQNIYIAIQAISVNEWELYIDNVVLHSVCDAPTNISVSAVGSDLMLTWDAIPTAESFTYFVVATGADPIPANYVADGTVTDGTLSSVTITGLDTSVDYDLYLSVECSPASFSDYDMVTYSTMAVHNNNIEGFDYYPNPVANTLQLRALENIKSYEVYNMLGQVIRKGMPETMSSEIDMSNFQSGTYFLKVTVGKETGIFKIVKQ